MLPHKCIGLSEKIVFNTWKAQKSPRSAADPFHEWGQIFWRIGDNFQLLCRCNEVFSLSSSCCCGVYETGSEAVKAFKLWRKVLSWVLTSRGPFWPNYSAMGVQSYQWGVWSQWADIICGCNRQLKLVCIVSASLEWRSKLWASRSWRPVRCPCSAVLGQNSCVSVNWGYLTLTTEAFLEMSESKCFVCQGTQSLVNSRMSSSLVRGQGLLFWISLLK